MTTPPRSPGGAARLTSAQRVALVLLAIDARYTSATTAQGHISGQCAAGLVRRGLARTRSNPFRIEITDEGRAALKEPR